jgi:hypothetical protein
MSKGIPIPEAMEIVKRDRKCDCIFFWINAIWACIGFAIGTKWILLNIACAAFLMWRVKRAEEKLEILKEMKARGYRAV